MTPSEETHGLNGLKQTPVQQILHSPAKQPDTQMVAAEFVSFSVRWRDLNEIICRQRVSTQCGVIQQSLIRIKRQVFLISVFIFKFLA